MKKKVIITAAVLAVFATALFTACSSGGSDGSERKTTTAKTGAVTQTDSGNKGEQTTSKRSSTHQEYVETVYVYAEQGAVVTWYDSQTGEYKYKCKCEECGHVSSSEHTNHRLTVQGASYNSSYVCENSDCIMWGKSQPVKISCNVSGEWVDVSD